MDLNTIKVGMRVEVTLLGSTDGMMINEKHLMCRRVGARGTVQSWVPGHGGDIWYVKHYSGEIAAYCFDEFEEIVEPDLISNATPVT